MDAAIFTCSFADGDAHRANAQLQDPLSSAANPCMHISVEANATLPSLRSLDVPLQAFKAWD
jgi:hypothetical protein